MKVKLSLFILYVLSFVFFINSCNPDKKTQITYPSPNWEKQSPQLLGIDAEKMQKALIYLEKYCGEDGIEEVVIVKDGFLAFQGDSVNKQHGIWSCTKSFTSTIFGLLIEEGKCSLEDKASLYEPLLTENYSKVTLKHFTTMTSGYNAIGKSRWDGGISEDWSFTPYKPDTPLFKPGTKYAYWDEAMMMFGRTLTRIANEDLYSFLDRKMMKPIDIKEWKWGNEGKINGITIRNGCTGIELNSLQLAKVGYLFLNNGKWKDEQLVPESWIKQATQNQVPGDTPVAETDRKATQGNGSYGYNWWICSSAPEIPSAMPNTPEGSYYMSGFNNNVCFVIPKCNMVFVRMGVDGNPPEGKHVVYNEFFKKLAEAILK